MIRVWCLGWLGWIAGQRVHHVKVFDSEAAAVQWRAASRILKTVIWEM